MLGCLRACRSTTAEGPGLRTQSWEDGCMVIPARYMLMVILCLFEWCGSYGDGVDYSSTLLHAYSFSIVFFVVLGTK